MKKHLGKIFIFIILFVEVTLYGSSYKWSANINKSEAVINEAVHLQYICEFDDNGELYMIDFNPMGEYEKYRITLLKEDETLVDGKRTSFYEFVAYPKVAGVIDFDFDVKMKKTTQESINYTTKSRDDDRGDEDFILKITQQKRLTLNVKSIDTNLVGDFKIDVKKDKEHLNAFEPYHLSVTIKGKGNLSDIKALQFKIDGVKVFTQEPTLQTTITQNGEEGEWNQKFAFVGEKDFKIPQKNISFYSLEEKKIKNIGIKEISLKLKTIYKKEELLDKEEESFQFSFDFLYYIFSFVAGFLVAKIKFKKNSKNLAKDNFLEKIENAKSLEKLNLILIMQDPVKYKEIIMKIERKEVTSLNNVKKYLKT